MANELGFTGKIIDSETLNTTGFNNIGPEFFEVVMPLSLCDTPISFVQLTNAFINYETSLADQHQLSSNANQSAIAPTIQKTIYHEDTSGRRRDSHGRNVISGRSGGHRRDPCPIYGFNDHSHY